jgi:hypothetical protein
MPLSMRQGHFFILSFYPFPYVDLGKFPFAVSGFIAIFAICMAHRVII